MRAIREAAKSGEQGSEQTQPALPTTREIRRIVRAVRSCGLPICRLEITFSGIAIVATGADGPASEAELENELANWRAGNGKG